MERKLLRSLTPTDVATLLRAKRLGAFADGFFEQDYDGEVLAEICDDSDLKDFSSIAKPKRKKLLRLLAEWQELGVPVVKATARDAAAPPPSADDGSGADALLKQPTAVDGTFEQRLAQLRRGFDGHAAAERQTLQPLRAVLARIVDSPRKSKYRRVKVGSGWGVPLCAVLGASDSVALLRAVGFVEQTVGGGTVLALEDGGAAALAPLTDAIAKLDRRLSELSAFVADVSSPFSVTVDDVRPSGSGASTLRDAAATPPAGTTASATPARRRFTVPLRYAAVEEQLGAGAQPLSGGMGAEERAAMLRDPRIAASVREHLKRGAGATQTFAFRLGTKERAACDAERRKNEALASSFRLRVEFAHDAVSLSAQFHPAETIGAVRSYLGALLEGGGSAGRAFDLRPALASAQPVSSATLIECGVAPSGRLCLRWTEGAALDAAGVAAFVATLRARIVALDEEEEDD